MTQDERNNWLKVKEGLEKVGKTDCMFYTRACAIALGADDPLEPVNLEDVMKDSSEPS